MSGSKDKWNAPGWPWELELITLVFFLLALLLPFYFHTEGLGQTQEEIRRAAANNGINVGRNTLSTQIGFLLSFGIAALYILHISFAFMEASRITVSPFHLLSPCAFAVIAYYRVDAIPNLQDTALSVVDGSVMQAMFVLITVAIITLVLARLRTYRYMLKFQDVKWDITTPALYDKTYFSLIFQLRPLLYAPRRYRACNEGIIVEGWYYAMPIGFSVFQSISKMAGSGIMNSGMYYAGTTRNMVRIELHDSIKATYISPDNRDEFVMYCAQHVVRRKASNKASPTHHDVNRSADTVARDTKHGDKKSSVTH
ncbi:MAG TPA: hypothetical protein PJ991_10150 [Kiritimatiellia bacterium]|nr:hypothetical protein [Kiritimatiellia bacterium]